MIRWILFSSLLLITSASYPFHRIPLTKLPNQYDYSAIKFLEMLSFSRDVTFKDPMNKILIERMACVDAASMRDPFVSDSDTHVEVFKATSRTGLIKLEKTESEIDCKGMLLVRMLHLILGDEAFQQELKKFTDAHKEAIVSSEELWNAFDLQKAGVPSGVTLKKIIDSWTENVRYPVVTVTREAGGQIKVQQKRLMGNPLYTARPGGSSDNSCWWIPVTYSTANAPEFSKFEPKAWLGCDKADAEVTLKTDAEDKDWIVLNNQFEAPYHVNYDQKSWDLITAALKDEKEFTKIHVLNRAQLVNDVISLAYINEVDYRTLFKLLNYLKHETDLTVWKFFFININKLTDLMMRTYQYDEFRDYMNLLLNKIFDKTYPDTNALTKVINDNKHSDDDDEMWTARFIFGEGCYFKVKKCVDFSKKMFEEWKTKGVVPKVTEPVSQEIVTEVLCTAAREGDAPEYEFIFKQMTESKEDDPMRNVLLQTVACTFNQYMVEDSGRLLDWATKTTSDNISPQEKEKVYINVVKNWIDFIPTTRFFYRSYDKIESYYKPDALGRIFEEMGLQMDGTQFNRFKNYVDSKSAGKFLEVQKALLRATPATIFRSNWTNNHKWDMVDAFREAKRE